MQGSGPRVFAERVRARLRGVRDWASVRPEFVARRAPSLTWATRGVVAGAASVALVAVLVAGLALATQGGPGPQSARPSVVAAASGSATPRPTPTETPFFGFSVGPFDTPTAGYVVPSFIPPTPTPAIATETPSEAPSGTQSAIPSAIPTATTAPAPTQPPGTVTPKVTKSVACPQQWLGGAVTVDGPTIYVLCGPTASESAAHIQAVDSATGRILAKYPSEWEPSLVDHGLWVTQDAHEGDNLYQLWKFDLSTHKSVFNLNGYSVVGDGFGYVWALDATSKKLMKINPTTLARTTLTLPGQVWGIHIACGSLWSSDKVGLHRLDPATGANLFTYAGAARPLAILELDGACWAITNTSGHALVRIGSAGFEVQYKMPAGTELMDLDGTVWARKRGPYELLQRVDPASGALVGPIWAVADSGDYVAAGGSVWVVDWDGGLRCLDIPLGPLPAAASSSPAALPSVAPSPSPSAAAS